MSDLKEELFKGLDMHNLIEGPLTAACKAQSMLAASTAEFLEKAGFEEIPDENNKVRTTTFSFQRGMLGENGENIGSQTVHLEIPVLSIVDIPAFKMDDRDITFDMDVKSIECSEKSGDKEETSDGGTKVGWGPFSADVKIKGSIVQRERNTKSTDNEPKYKVDVHALDHGTSEGLKEVLEKFAIASSTTPWEQINNSENEDDVKKTKK
ncbi:MAG: DUF2589 domain-containing protein [Lachnospiraceae bacterium]